MNTGWCLNMNSAKNNQRIIFTAGGFDPIHIGHLDIIRRSRALDPEALLIVSIAQNRHLILKKGFYFMDQHERLSIVEQIKGVDQVIFHQGKDGSVITNLLQLRGTYPDHEIIFTKGGDRHTGNIPETKVCQELGIEIIDGLGDKVQSSTDLLSRYYRLRHINSFPEPGGETNG